MVTFSTKSGEEGEKGGFRRGKGFKVRKRKTNTLITARRSLTFTCGKKEAIGFQLRGGKEGTPGMMGEGGGKKKVWVGCSEQLGVQGAKTKILTSRWKRGYFGT